GRVVAVPRAPRRRARARARGVRRRAARVACGDPVSKQATDSISRHLLHGRRSRSSVRIREAWHRRIVGAMLADGFLGRPSTFGADFNLLLQIGLGLLLFVGFLLVRRSKYALHGACQSVALVGVIVMTAIWMLPAYHNNYGPVIFKLGNRVNMAAAAHVAAGSVALLLGI